jgi:hypothetical protein
MDDPKDTKSPSGDTKSPLGETKASSGGEETFPTSNWKELSLTEDHMVRLIRHIHNVDPVYMNGKKYRLRGDPGRKGYPQKIWKENGQYVRRLRVFCARDHENILIKIISGTKHLWFDREDMFDDCDSTLELTTIYKEVFRLPFEEGKIGKKNPYYLAPTSRGSSKETFVPSFVISDIKIKDIPTLD